jgi:hypothetical protein
MKMTVDQYRDHVKKSASEADVQTRVCQYLRRRGLKFRTDKDGQHVSGYSARIKGEQKGVAGFPDLVIREDSFDGASKGLVIELKKDGVKVFRKDGTLKDDQHLRDQMMWLEWFRSMGCRAEFCVGYDEAIRVINEYFNFK